MTTRTLVTEADVLTVLQRNAPNVLGVDDIVAALPSSLRASLAKRKHGTAAAVALITAIDDLVAGAWILERPSGDGETRYMWAAPGAAAAAASRALAVEVRRLADVLQERVVPIRREGR